MEAGRKLDALVGEKVMGWSTGDIAAAKMGGLIFPPDYPEGNPHPIMPPLIPSYSTNIAAAWQVVEKLATQFLFQVTARPRDQWHVVFLPLIRTASEPATAEASTAPHAICLAALTAINAEVPTH